MDIQADSFLAISPYVYVANNPLLFIDPNGEEIWINTQDGQRVQYRDGRLWTNYNQGQEYVAQHGSFAAQIQLSLNHIAGNGGSVGAELISFLDQNGSTEIQIGQPPSNIGGTIIWNPTESIINERGEVLSPALGLAHELGHSANILLDGNQAVTERKGQSDLIWGDNEEKLTVEKWEQPISDAFAARGFGSHTREHHGLSDFVTVVGGPTSTRLSISAEAAAVKAQKVDARLNWPAQKLIQWRREGMPGRRD